MEWTIRPAAEQDLPRILEIYDHARQYMAQTGNPNQWKDGHPAASMLEEDIRKAQLFVCTEGQEILGVFYYSQGIDPTYLHIEDGTCLNDEPYGVIHRIAVADHRKGVASFCFAYALSQCPNLRIDTHRDNLPMQRSLAKNGFSRCGIIYLANGEQRIAYQKVI